MTQDTTTVDEPATAARTDDPGTEGTGTEGTGTDSTRTDSTAGSRATPTLTGEVARLLITASSAMLSLHDAEGRFLYASPGFADVLGHDPKTLVGTHPRELLHPADLGDAENRGGDSAGDPLPGERPQRLRHADGHYVWVETESSLIDESASVTSGPVVAAHTRPVPGQDDLMEDLEEARAEAHRLRGLSDLRTGFLTAVSHALQGPLETVMRLTSSLRDSDPQGLDAHTERLLEQMVSGVGLMDRRLNDLVDAERLLRGAWELDPQPVNLGDMLHDVATTATLPDRPVNVTIEDPTTAVLDEDQIRRAVALIIDNAIIHAPAGTPVDVTLIRSGGEVRITVDDRGPGIPDSMKEHAFAPFVRRSVEDSEPGLGLGLYLVGEIVRRHNGTASLEDRAGGGARVAVTLPLSGGVRGAASD